MAAPTAPRVAAVLLLAGALAACATRANAPTGPLAPQVRLAAFGRVELAPAALNPELAGHKVNLKAVARIDENLFARMSGVFPGLQRVDPVQPVQPGEPRTLRVVPYVRQIRFINGAARFFAGALAGDSAVVMQVTFVDGATGQVIAQPEFHRSGDAVDGAQSIGVSDNLMLDAIAADVAAYASAYR